MSIIGEVVGGRIVVALLTNRSGGSVAQGDVVIRDDANDKSFTTSTTQGDRKVVGVVLDASIADLASGRIVTFGGPVKVNVTGAVARGDYLRQSATAKLAESAGAAYVEGVFGIALTSAAGPGTGTVEAVLLGAEQGVTPHGHDYEKTFTFVVPGALSVQSVSVRLHAPRSGTIENVTAAVNTAPGGQAVIVDVNKNGTTIFTTQANRPTIVAGTTEDLSSVPDVTDFVQNDVFTIDIDQVGADPAGADLVVQIRTKVAVE